MKVDEIFCYNNGMLYSATVRRSGDSQLSAARVFRKHSGSVFSKAAINFLVSEVTMIELVALKDYASKITVIGNDITINDYDDSQLTGLWEVISTIHNDDSINTEPYISLLPADMVEQSVMVEFTGLELTEIITSFPDQFFAPIFTKTEPHPITGEPMIVETPPLEIPTDDETAEKIKDALIEAFLNGFYRYAATSFMNLDPCSDGVNKAFYHDLGKDKLVSLIEFASPTGMVNMFSGQESVKEDLIRFKKFKDGILLNSDYDNDFVMENIHLNIVIKSSLATFCILKSALPKRFISDYTDFKFLVSSHDSVNIGEFGQYENVIDNKKAYLEHRLVELNQDERSIRHFFAIPLYRPISYTMQMTLYDINYTLMSHITGATKFVDKNSFINDEINTVIQDIAKVAMVVKSSVFK